MRIMIAGVVDVLPIPVEIEKNDLRNTEQNDPRVTENGERRITEDNIHLE